jgi:hypothetical protein
MWKLWTNNENVRPPIESAAEFETREQALRRACDLIRKSAHVKPLRIEQPNDAPDITLDDIKLWCTEQPGD